MSRKIKNQIPLLITITFLSIFYFMGVGEVPFHPDESTQIFMGRDIELLFSQPSAVKFNPEDADNLRQKYRLLDPPLSRWFIGSAQILFKLPPLENDWDWSKSWDDNIRNGALPSAEMLIIARLAVCFVFPATLYLSYQIGQSLGGKPTAWLNLFLTALNALVLLHTRRAMAESLLIFFYCMTLYWAVKPQKPTWLIALPAALAFNAKYSAVSLFLTGTIFCFFYPPKHPNKANILKSLLFYALLCILITFLLNPVLWNSPLKAVKAAALERQTLLEAQTKAIGSYNPAQTPSTLSGRLLAVVAQVYIAPPAVADVGNYLTATQPQSSIYFSRPWNDLTSGFFRGGFLLALSLIGLILMIRHQFSTSVKLPNPQFLFILAFLFQIAAILIGIPLSFQRYYLPLLPYITIFIAYAVEAGLRSGLNHSPQKADSSINMPS